MEQKFYICKHCGNIIAKVKDAGVPVICCGEPMSEIIPGTTDAAVEKHVPVWTVENGIVQGRKLPAFSFHSRINFSIAEFAARYKKRTAQKLF